MLELKQKQTEQIEKLEQVEQIERIEPADWTPRWKIGVDRKQVAVYVGLAIVAGFALGFATARYISEREIANAAHRPAIQPEPVAPTIVQPAGYHRVARVLRADTVEIAGMGPVRMIGIETPDGKTPQEVYELHGKNALAFAEKLLQGQEVRIEFDPQNAGRDNKDESGNLMAYLYTRDGMLINAEMVKQGHAFVRVSEQFKSLDAFRNLEREAMQATLGVWGVDAASSTTASTTTASDEGRRRLTPLLPSEIGPNLPAGTGDTAPSEPMVFISSADRLYHKSACDYLDKAKKQTTPLSKAKSDGYGACGRCFASTVLKAP